MEQGPLYERVARRVLKSLRSDNSPTDFITSDVPWTYDKIIRNSLSLSLRVLDPPLQRRMSIGIVAAVNAAYLLVHFELPGQW